MSDMTREEAIEVIEQDIPCEHDKDLIEALEMAISAVSAIEKIRAEIAEIPNKYPMTADYENGIREALSIIDKHIWGKDK